MADPSLEGFNPNWCIHPGTTLRECIKGISSRDFARAATLDRTFLLQILACNPKARISLATASKIEMGLHALGVPAPSARFWTALEANYRDGLRRGRKDMSTKT